MASFALALGTATQNQDGKIIEAYFPAPCSTRAMIW